MVKSFIFDVMFAFGLRVEIAPYAQIKFSMETCNPLQGFGSHAKGEKRKALFFEK
jgi:hypothetical protein